MPEYSTNPEHTMKLIVENEAKNDEGLSPDQFIECVHYLLCKILFNQIELGLVKLDTRERMLLALHNIAEGNF